MAGEPGMCGIATVAPPESVIGTPVCMMSAPKAMAVSSATQASTAWRSGCLR